MEDRRGFVGRGLFAKKNEMDRSGLAAAEVTALVASSADSLLDIPL